MAGISQDPEFKTYQGVRFEIPRAVLQALLSRENPVIVLQDVQDYPNLPYLEVFHQVEIKTLAIATLFRAGHFNFPAIFCSHLQSNNFKATLGLFV